MSLNALKHNIFKHNLTFNFYQKLLKVASRFYALNAFYNDIG